MSGAAQRTPGIQRAALLRWFARRKRALPWRREPRDPYHVWLSEVMLQQTQVATVVPYFERWLLRYPTLQALAQAPLDDVLKAWEGLGYYSRARNFHKAARVVQSELGGAIPDTVEALLRLPGVGRYTAGAIASLAFNRRAAVLDGNVRRVLSRLFALGGSADLWQLAESLAPARGAGAWNEALMELGATICTPRAPKCAECPLRPQCRALALGEPERYPERVRKPATPHHHVLTAVVSRADGCVLMGQRPPEGLLGGLWEFVSSDFRASSPPDDAASLVRARTGLSIWPQVTELGSVRHAFTHFKITRQIVAVRAVRGNAKPAGYAALRWMAVGDLGSLALTRSDQKIFALLKNAAQSDR